MKGRNSFELHWVSFEGLTKLRRSSADNAAALWFGGEAPDLEVFYERAPLSVRRAVALERAPPFRSEAAKRARGAAERGRIRRR